MNIQKLIELKKQYYLQPEVLHKILREIQITEYQYREVAIINKTKKRQKIAFRGITFSSVDFFIKTLVNEHYDFGLLYNDANLYVSRARVKRFPNFPFKNRTESTRPFYKNEYEKYVFDYDLYLDFDLEDMNNIHDFIYEVKSLIEKLARYRLRFEFVFSGNRGFKILIWNNIYSGKQIEKIALSMLKKYELKYLDTSCLLHIPSKLMKCNFSLETASVIDSDRKIPNVVLPLKISNYKYFFNNIFLHGHFNEFNVNSSRIRNILRTPGYTSDFLPKGHGSMDNLKEFVEKERLL